MSAAVAITPTDHTAAELRALASKCRDGAQVRRLLALAMVMEGCRRTDAAVRNGMDRQTLRDWVHRYNDGGIEGLKSLASPGPSPALTAEQMAELRDLVLQGSDPAVHKVTRWRCADLREEVARRYDVSVHESTIGKWLHQLGLQPGPTAPLPSTEGPGRRRGVQKNSPSCCQRSTDFPYFGALKFPQLDGIGDQPEL